MTELVHATRRARSRASEPIVRPPSLRLPSLDDGTDLLRAIRSLASLPFSVAEHGCGQKASQVIDGLVQQGVPPWAIDRGVLVEADLSPEALREEDPSRRPDAMVLDNPLHALADVADARIGRVLAERYGATVDDDAIQVEDWRLDLAPRVQFRRARSHVFVAIRVWDPNRGQAIDRVIDPTVEPQKLIDIADLRTALGGHRAYAFRAPLLGAFRLDSHWLTPSQEDQLERLGILDGLETLRDEDHTAQVRRLLRAEPGGPGDPDTWTYANTVESDPERSALRRRRTGDGYRLRWLRRDLESTLDDDAAVVGAQHLLDEEVERLDLRTIVRDDASWSAQRLEPLTRAVHGLRYLQSLRGLFELRGHWARLLERDGEAVAGLGLRLRDRLHRLADVSRDGEGRIDARTLEPGYDRVALECIRQMNEAGMEVVVDAVGNLHGLWPARAAQQTYDNGGLDLSGALCFGSHIDSVLDAGAFDGRVGVASGIEITHALDDLRRIYDFDPAGDAVAIVVSAFLNEETSFAGEGIAMSGSAAVAGLAPPERVYTTRNHRGESYGERLLPHLRALGAAQSRGAIEIRPNLTSLEGEPPQDLQALLPSLPHPATFRCRHTYERHIEQASALAELDTPAALASAIMGIYQADLEVGGDNAASAALSLVRAVHGLVRPRSTTRVTVGMFRPSHGQTREGPVLRCRLDGAADHAGAPPMDQRRDAMAAAAILVGNLEATCERDGIPLTIGAVRVTPGENRNVIPGSVEVDLVSAELERVCAAIPHDVGAVTVTTVRDRGTTAAGSVRLSVDVRAESKLEQERVATAIERLAGAPLAGCRVHHELVQRHRPFALARTGQALILERSFGGSHNPLEHQRLDDLTVGTALQLAVTEDALRGSLRQRSVHELVATHLPHAWTSRIERIMSAACHDTANIAAAFDEGERH